MSDGNVKRLKARLVNKGDTKREGINFTEVLFLMTKMTAIRCV